ncbi:MAG: hypothetical protein HQL67_07455 [Magnetococcales bacterium]|nr:hypothetical protein [Magnetococcales bacterium]
MNEISWIELLILGTVLALCLRYIYKSAHDLFSNKKKGISCGCSASGSCRVKQEEKKAGGCGDSLPSGT